MTAFTDTIANQLLEQVFGSGPAYVAPDPLYLALLTAPPDGTTITEIVYTGYARVAVPKSSFAAASERQKRNSVAITFPAATSNAALPATWGALLTAATGGTLVLTGELIAPLEVFTGQTPQLKSLALAVGFP